MRGSFEQLIEKSRKKTLTPEDQRLLEGLFAQDPTLKSQWDQERRLSQMLASLPQVPLSEDFNQKVLQQTFWAKDRRPARRRGFASWMSALSEKHWTQAVAAVCVISFVTFGAYLQHNQVQKIRETADALSTVANTAAEIATVQESDLEAIQILGEYEQGSSIDDDLWLAMVSD